VRISCTEYKSNDWVPQETRIESHLLDETKKTNLSYLGHILSKDGSYLEKGIIRCIQLQVNEEEKDQGHVGYTKWTGLRGNL